MAHNADIRYIRFYTDGSAAKKIVADYTPEYPSIRAYLDAIDQMILDKDAVVYDENGNATVDFKN